MTSRRAFLSALAASAAACRVGPGRPSSADSPGSHEPPDASRPGPGFTSEQIAAAERVLGVQYTADEREQIAATLEEQLALAGSRRGLVLPNGLHPATVFDPRPAGYSPPPAAPLVMPAVDDPLPASDDDLAFASAAQQSHWIASGQLRSRRLTELYLSRLDRLAPDLQCVITRTDELALAQADRADAELAAGRRRGPLHGLVWGAKDLFDTRDIPTTWGAAPYRDRVPTSDATVVTRLEQAGAVLAAKLSLGALAYGDLWFGGRTNNPWNRAEGSSGSSAGSAAAVAAGLVSFTLGTETLGSIVSPSMRCGVTGLRPTFGRVPRTGAMALCWSMDKVGPIARTVEDTAMVLDGIDGADPGDPSSLDVPRSLDLTAPIKGVRVGVIPGWFADEGLTDVERTLPTAVRAAGFEVVELPSLPELPYAAMYTILYAEAAAAFEAMTDDGTDDALTWQADQAWPNTFRRAKLLSALDLVAAQRIRRRVMEAVGRLFTTVDVLAGPSFAGGMLLLTNMTGHPSLTLRAGFEERGPVDSLTGAPQPGATRDMPIGVTLWGRLFDEGALCRVGLALQHRFGVAERRPPGF